MSIEASSTQELKTSRLAEIINPLNLPEAGFQSYEEFKNDAVGQKEQFLNGDIVNPHLDYPKFKDPSGMDKGILRLFDTIEQVDRYTSNLEHAQVIKSSLEFRAAEMEFVKLLARLDFAVNEGVDEADIRELAEEARVLNERLYSTPKVEIVAAALNEVWTNLESKSLSDSAQKIYDELMNGFSWNEKEIAPLPYASNSEIRLPSFNDASLAWAGEHILEANADIRALINEFWQSKIDELGEDYVCPPADIVEALEKALLLLDPNNESGVRVLLDQDATALSWESPLMAVKVGAKRAPIKTEEDLFEKVLHELRVHGGRAISGLKSSLPVLGTGLYTETERPDYLTFEEGLATTVEEVVSSKEPKWDGIKIGHYLNIALAKDGRDFRSVFETSWRYRLLMGLKDDAEVTDEMIKKSQASAYTGCIRIFRGTQTDLSDSFDIAPMTFNKDLAYLEGRVLAMGHLAELYSNNDTEGLDRLFLAKYDPTNPVQDAIVRTVFAK
ncbi:DUF1704 domain-containing protein [Pedobacter sp.]|nr:DUF1704 domain-containing protein [Candidatus Saccharibacteria bacterium]